MGSSSIALALNNILLLLVTLILSIEITNKETKSRA